MARHEALAYLSLPDRPWFFTLHRKESDFDFITIFMNTIGDEEISDRLVLLSVSDDSLVNNSSGQILFGGNKDFVNKASEM